MDTARRTHPDHHRMVARTKNTETTMNLPRLPTRPKFKNEGEEAEWWYKNRKIIGRRFSAEAVKNSKAISIRLPVSDIELAKQQAEHMGIGYQTLIRTLLHEGLKRHDQKTTRR